MFTTNEMYSFSAPTSPSASSSASLPQSGFQPSHDFWTGTGGAGGVFDMQGMNMEFGGDDVPVADKESMLWTDRSALIGTR